MFTGIIEDVGEIIDVYDAEDFRRLRIRAPGILEDIRTGSSIATNGVCLTAREVVDDCFVTDLSRETLERTTFQKAAPGQKVNLERPMRADSRFGGHIVQGHVDGIGRVRRFDRTADEWTLEVGYPAAFESRLVWKGSVAIDGISLTVAGLDADALSIAIIPYTLENTNLGERRPGDPVNLEFDVLAKYVERLVTPYLERLGKGPA